MTSLSEVVILSISFDCLNWVSIDILKIYSATIDASLFGLLISHDLIYIQLFYCQIELRRVDDYDWGEENKHLFRD